MEGKIIFTLASDLFPLVFFEENRKTDTHNYLLTSSSSSSSSPFWFCILFLAFSIKKSQVYLVPVDPEDMDASLKELNYFFLLFHKKITKNRKRS